MGFHFEFLTNGISETVKNLAALAVKYRPIVITLVTLLVLWGILSILTMPRREDPEYTVRTCVVTTVCVDSADPAFANPTKPIGSFYDQTQAEKLQRQDGWIMSEVLTGQYRRVVASPRPQKILEAGSIKHRGPGCWPRKRRCARG